jgi:hypothetical protein
VTLNGAVTVTTGAAVSVDPVTATLPVVPGSVHSGVATLAGAAVGHWLSAPGTEVETRSGVEVDDTGDDAGDDVFEPEPHAASVTTSAAADAVNAIQAELRDVFTPPTLSRYESFLGSG